MIDVGEEEEDFVVEMMMVDGGMEVTGADFDDCCW